MNTKKHSAKRLSKIVLSILIFTLLIGAVAIFGGAENEARKLLRQATYDNGKPTGQTAVSTGTKGWSKIETVLQLDGNYYAEHSNLKHSDIAQGADMTDSFFDLNVVSYGLNNPTLADYSFVTADIDFMTRTGEYATNTPMTLNPLLRSYNASGSLVSGSSHFSANMSLKIEKVNGLWYLSYYYVQDNGAGKSGQVLLNNGAYKWNHLSYVFDIDYTKETGYKNSRYSLLLNGETVIDGALLFNQTNYKNDPSLFYNNDTSIVFLDVIRLDHYWSGTGGNANEDYSFCVDNAYVYGYDADYTGEVEHVYNKDYKFPLGNVYAAVDGVYYEDRDEAVTAINNAKEKIKLHADFPDASLVVGSKALKIEKNGYELGYTLAEGFYETVDSKGVISFSNDYKVYWHNGDKGVIEETYSYGALPTAPFTPVAGKYITVDGVSYKLSGGWALSDGKNTADTIGTVTGDTHYYPARADIAFYYAYKTSETGKVYYMSSAVSPNAAQNFLSHITQSGAFVWIQLMSDITLNQGISLPGNKTVYLDLNGHSLTYTEIVAHTFNSSGTVAGYDDAYGGKDSSFIVGNGATLNLYSSLPGGTIYNSAYNHGHYNENGELIHAGLKGIATVNIGSSTQNATANIGKVKYEGVTADGDNLSVYGPALLYVSGNSTNKVNIDGGAYYKTVSDQPALLTKVGNTVITVKNATLASSSSPLFATYLQYNAENKYTTGIDVDGCILYAKNAMFGEWNTNCRLNLTNSYILSDMSGYSSTVGKVNIGSGVRFASGVSIYKNANTDGLTVVKTSERFTLDLEFNEFIYIRNDDDPVKSAYDKEASEKKNVTSVYTYISQVYASDSDYSNVTWNGFGTQVHEKWFKGIVPSSPFELPEDGRGYKYSIDTLHPAVGGEDGTDNVNLEADIPLLMNITLYADFIYNIYIPTSYSDIIEKAVLDGSVTALTETERINGDEYYVLRRPIASADGAKEYSLILTVLRDGAESFEQTYTFSIPKYCAYVLDGGYNEETKALMRSTLAYIKTACEYFGTDSTGIEDVGEISKAPAYEMQSVPSEVAAVFNSATLSVGAQTKFRFNVIADGAFTAEIKYVEMGREKTVTVTEKDLAVDEDGKYYSLSLRANDLRHDIYITVGESTFKYELANYNHYVNTYYAEDTKLLKLTDALWAYSTAAYGYNEEPPITDITVDGADIEGFVIVARTQAEQNVAAILRNQIYLKTGHLLDVVSSAEGKHITVTVDRNTLDDYLVTVKEGSMYVTSSLISFSEEATIKFADEFIKTINGAYDFDEGFAAAYTTQNISYIDMGAVGDGIADDYYAMKLAHEYANTRGYNVKVNSGSYNVGKHSTSIIIKTNVDWTGAAIITDDSKIAYDDAARQTSIFTVASDYTRVLHNESSSLVTAINQANGIDKDEINSTKKFFDYVPGYRVMLLPYDTDNIVYIRYGGNANSGNAQHELIVIEPDGTVNEDTDLLLDYAKVSYIYEYRIDDKPITIKGGTIITIANQAPCNYTYYGRNITIQRSNTIIDGITHKVIGEGDTGAPYSGFINISNCSDVTVMNATLWGHRAYFDEAERAEDGTVTKWGTMMGTYDIGGGTANALYFKNCIQENFDAGNVWRDENNNTALNNKGNRASTWGVMGTNYCKNITYDGCRINRLDAHAGVVNASIINGSEVTTIALIGGGVATVKDSIVHGNSIIGLREDYGSTWNGDVILENVQIMNSGSVSIVSGYWANHDFGYTTYMPKNIYMNNVTFKTAASVYMVSDYSRSNTYDISLPTVNGTANLNPIVMPENVYISSKDAKMTYYTCPDSTIASYFTITYN